MPGIYNIGAVSLQMADFVDIEGSGENATKLVGNVESGCCSCNGVVNGASNAELRFISVENTGGAAVEGAMAICAFAPIQISNTKIIASNGTNRAVGILARSNVTIQNSTITATNTNYATGIAHEWSAISALSDVKITASGIYNSTGLALYSTQTTAKNVTITASSASGYSYGIIIGSQNSNLVLMNAEVTALGSAISYGLVNGGTAKIYNSILTGDSATISNTGTTNVGSSQLNGGQVIISSGAINCAGVYDENLAFYLNNCP